MANVIPSTASLPGCAVVTGAASGIGQATSLALALAGCSALCLLDINETGLEDTRSLITRHPATTTSPRLPKITVITCDVACPDSVTDAFTQAHGAMGRIDYSIHCAGIFPITGPSSAPTATVEAFDRQNNVNYRGLWLCSRAALSIMTQQSLDCEAYPAAHIPAVRAQRGSIVNMASSLARASMEGVPAYCASKAAVVASTRSDAVDHAVHRVRVNAVCPGIVDSPMTSPSAEQRAYLEENVVPKVPMKRMGVVEEVADVCVFLAGNAASLMTGSEVLVDGGMSAW